MAWGRRFIGRTNHQGLVHALYEWDKLERMFWETQCGYTWGFRENTNPKLKPPLTKAPALTCFVCIRREP